MSTYQHAAVRWRRVGRWIGWAVVAVLVVAAGLFAWDAWQLKTAAAELKVHAVAAQDAIAAGDASGLAREVDAVQAAAVKFARAASGPHWWVADRVPWVKAQTVPLHQAGLSTLTVADGALAPLAALPNLDALKVPAIVDGRIDPLVLEPYRPTLARAADAMNTALAELADVSLSGTLTPIRTPFLEMRSELASLGATIQGAHVAAEVLPSMLGADGPRTYLVMVQNNAEPRTTGGIPGAVLKVRVDGGQITLEKYASANSMIEQNTIGARLTEDEARIFGERMLIYPQDVNFTPEFPRSAFLMTQFWANTYGDPVDGVVSVDPVALGYMLKGMAPTKVRGIEITDENLSRVMLNESYLTFPDPKDQDAFFAAASQTLFGQLLSGGTSAISETRRAIDEGRFLVWSPNRAEQELLATTPVAGAFLERTHTLGIFVNDGSGSKIGYYVDSSAHVDNHMCTDGSLAGQTVTLTLTHTFNGSVADLPWYISGGGVYVPEGVFDANILLYPPAGEGVATLTSDGTAAQLYASTQDGRPFTSTRVVLTPGQSTTLVYELRANQRGLASPDVEWTPSAKPNVYTTTVDKSVEAC